MSKVQITIGEGLGWLFGKLHEWGQEQIPDADQLDILIKRLAGEVNQKRVLYHDALKEEVKIQDPEHPDDGSLPDLRETLARREAQGTKYGSELTGTPAPSKRRATTLKSLLDQCATDCEKLEKDIAAEEEVLKMRQETTRLRKDAYVKAKADLKRLEDIGPTLVQHTSALEDAQKERLEALRAESGSGDQAADLIRQLDAEFKDAKAGDRAAELMVDEEEDDTPDLDEIEEQEASEAASNERIARWTKRPAAENTPQ